MSSSPAIARASSGEHQRPKRAHQRAHGVGEAPHIDRRQELDAPLRRLPRARHERSVAGTWHAAFPAATRCPRARGSKSSETKRTAVM